MIKHRAILFSFLFIIITQVACNLIPDVKTPNGFYTEIKGECRIGIFLKDLSHGKYVLVLTDKNGDENEIVGTIVENVIFTKIGDDPAYFALNGKRILMIYQGNKCIFEKKE